MVNKITQPDPDNVREEYKALIAYHNSVVTYRFTLLGFFAAAVAFIAKQGMEKPQALLLLSLTIALYIVERRNRVLYTQMSKRAVEIEKKHWQFNRSDNNDGTVPLFCRFWLNELSQEEKDKLPNELKKELKSMRRWSIRRLTASHTVGLNIFYLSVMLYGVWSLLPSMNPPSQDIAMRPITLYLITVAFALAIIMVGVSLIKSGVSDKEARWPLLSALLGALLSLGLLCLFFVSPSGKLPNNGLQPTRFPRG
jgi:hypothetical protein